MKTAGKGILTAVLLMAAANIQGSESVTAPITPNQFKGSDIDRIQAAVDAAKGTTNKIIIPSVNAATGTDLWLIDSAILLPSDMTVILDNCTLQLSNQARDNWFRSDNIGIGITDPQWNRNIAIIGIGKVYLRGAEDPRSTGDYGKPIKQGNYRSRGSYGSDLGKEGVRQFGDSRNIGILIAKVDGFILRNVHLQDAHAWAISFERTHNAELSDLIIENHHYREINGVTQFIQNTDGINLRQGCKNFRINNISGLSGDDFIALTSFDIGPKYYGHGLEHSNMLTTREYRGPIDDTENIYITNVSCASACNGIAIRTNYDNRIRNVFINGLYYKGLPNRNLRMPDPWNHKHNDSMPVGKNAILIGTGRGPVLDKPGEGDIRGVYAMNIIAEDSDRGLATIKGHVYDIVFMNGLHIGGVDEAVTYYEFRTYTKTDDYRHESIIVTNMVTVAQDHGRRQHYLLGPEPVKLSNFVEIGHPGNAADTTGYGSVAYPYLISKYAVTIAEWRRFYLDAESGKTGPFREDYNFWGFGKHRVGWMGTRHPAVHVSFHQAAQYCNWLTTGSALKGAYAIDENGKVTGVDRTFRNADGLVYVLPTENEWYKAAYFKPDGSGYSLYADGTDTAPKKSTFGFTGWNYDNALNPRDPISPVQNGTKEQNGTCNMMGLVWEWLEDSSGAARGGAYNLDVSFIASSSRLADIAPEAEDASIGFRVVAIKK